jgi:hypothetical protein
MVEPQHPHYRTIYYVDTGTNPTKDQAKAIVEAFKDALPAKLPNEDVIVLGGNHGFKVEQLVYYPGV